MDFLVNNANRVRNLVSYYNRPAVQIRRDIMNGYRDYPFAFRNAMKQFGNEPIKSITIVRTPLSKTLNLALNIATLGQLKRIMATQPYEDFFHLKIIVNNKYSIEKSQVIMFTVDNKIPPRSETMDVSVPNGVSINTMLEKTKQNMGSQMFSYNFKTNNCQVFVSNLLKSIGIVNPEYHSFINQDVTSAFRGISAVSRKIINSTTDIGNRFNQLIEGNGISEGDGIYLKKQYTKLTTLSSSEIYNILAILDLKIVDNKIFMKDEMPIDFALKEGFYIMNLENINQGGSHWTCFLKDKKNVYYNDPFGVFVPQNQYDLFKANKLKIYYNEQQNQDVDATSCGWWCIYFIYFMKTQKGSYISKYKKFNNMFSGTDQLANERKLLDIINKLMKDK